MSMRAFPLLALVALLAAGCTGADGNLLQDAGFEEQGREWFWIEDSPGWLNAFEVTPNASHGGEAALRTRVLHNGTAPFGIVGAVQEVTRGEMGGRLPERMSGWYRVDNWTPPTAGRAYAQVVLGLFPRDDARDQVCPGVTLPSPCQVSYPLAGITEKPFNISNRKFVFLGDGQVRTGEWQRFEMNPREDFTREWGEEPRLFKHAWVYLEVRYEQDVAPEAESPVDLDVLWDDVELGP